MARCQQVARRLLAAPIQARKDDTPRRVSRFGSPTTKGGVPKAWLLYNTSPVL
jgi:hypothetical protein